jgi:hypothetical protein
MMTAASAKSSMHWQSVTIVSPVPAGHPADVQAW